QTSWNRLERAYTILLPKVELNRPWQPINPKQLITERNMSLIYEKMLSGVMVNQSRPKISYILGGEQLTQRLSHHRVITLTGLKITKQLPMVKRHHPLLELRPAVSI